MRSVSFAVDRGEMVGLVGESGAGKSLTAFAVARLLPTGVQVAGGRILLDGDDLLELPERALRRIRGSRVAMVFQEPMSSLDPCFSVGAQIAETVRAHERVSRREARRRAGELLELVALPDAERRLGAYPHELSGGQRQRVALAMALAGRPDLLLADEPTTALDVTVQARILELLDDLRRDLGLAVLLVTHDLAVVARSCSRAVVLYAGRVVEEAPVRSLFERPAHPYTRGLLAAVPDPDAPAARGPLATLPGTMPPPEPVPGTFTAAENRVPGTRREQVPEQVPGTRSQQVPGTDSGPENQVPGTGSCAFAPRCVEVFERCRRHEPPLYPRPDGMQGGGRVRCFLRDPDDPADAASIVHRTGAGR